MRNGIIASLATWALAVAACGPEDSGDDGAATTAPTTTIAMSTTDASAGSEEDTGEGETGPVSTTAPATTNAETTDPGDDTGAAEDPGTTTAPAEGTGATGMGEESSTGVMGSPCDPAPEDDDCESCTKQMCCPQLETCFDDPICVCMSMCVMGFGDFDPCAQMCGQTANFMPVTDCAASSCLLQCIG
jgi:hypothetical protein